MGSHQYGHKILLHEHHRDDHGNVKVKLKLMILQVHHSNVSPSVHAILAFLFPLLLNFLQLKFSADQASLFLFQTHPIITMLPITSLLAYWLSLGASLRFPCYSHWFRIAAVFFGLLSVASLSLLLFPHLLFLLPYVIYVLVLVPVLLLPMFILPLYRSRWWPWRNTTPMFADRFDSVLTHPLFAGGLHGFAVILVWMLMFP